MHEIDKGRCGRDTERRGGDGEENGRERGGMEWFPLYRPKLGPWCSVLVANEIDKQNGIHETAEGPRRCSLGTRSIAYFTNMQKR